MNKLSAVAHFQMLFLLFNNLENIVFEKILEHSNVNSRKFNSKKQIIKQHWLKQSIKCPIYISKFNIFVLANNLVILITELLLITNIIICVNVACAAHMPRKYQ